ncbi:MAG: hypothetical protein V4671_02465 [Armatimonadota bacterium]
MKDKILQTLRPLIGEPLTDMMRFAGIQVFEFGVQRPRKNRKGEDITRADQRLHVSCSWEIAGADGFVLSREDFGPEGVRQDEKAHPFYESLQTDDAPVVEAIEADDAGVLRLQLSQGYMLQIQPDEMEEEPDEEQWRFLPKDRNQRHLVLTLQGIGQY